jgi:hypothetical protein
VTRLLTLLILFALTELKAQVLFTEDFETEPNGATSGTAGGTLGGTWSANSPGGTFSRQDLFRNSFLVDGTGSEGVWTTSVIDISGSGYAIVDLVLGSVGVGFDNGDYVRAYYIIDNSGVEVLFAELSGSLAASTLNGSAIVSGSSLQIVVRAFDNSFFGVMDFDDVTIAAIPVLYSRKSGTWTDITGGLGGTGTWSTDRSGTPACGCVPLNDVLAIVQAGHTVTLPASQTAVGGSGTPNLAPGGVEIEAGGIVQFNVNSVTLGIQYGYFKVQNGGLVNSSAAGITGETISFNGNVALATLTLDAGSSVTVENLILGTNATNSHFMEGGGSLVIQNDIVINAAGASLTNNLTTPIVVTDRIQFSTGATGSSFVNNQTITANTLFFDDDGGVVSNSRTMTLQDVIVNVNSDDNNTVNNSGTLTLNSTTISIDANSADVFINNNGTIDQRGNFADLVAASNYINLPTGIWRLELNNNVIPANFASVLDCSQAGNTFYYNGSANQNIGAITYHHLILTNGGNKTLSASLDVNGDLTIESAATLAGAANTIDVDGNISITGSGVLGGTGAIAVGGNWSAAGASSFTEGTRTVTFDGAATATISNSSGTETFYSLTLNKTAAANTVGMQNDVTVSQTLTLTRGRLLLNGNALRVTRSNNSAITGASANGFIVSETTASPYGRIVWTTGTSNATFTFPFGTLSGSYIPYSLVKTVGATAAGTVSVATYGTGPANTPYPSTVGHTSDAAGDDQSALVVDRYWMVNTTGYATLTGTQNMSFVASEATSVTAPRAAQRWDGSGTWTPKVGNSSANPFPIPSSNLATSSIWVVVSNSIALPVEWLDFDVRLNNHEVEISWKTAMESNNDYFTVERAQDIERFEPLATVPGKGTTSAVSSYSVVDPNPMHGTTYYRVKQIDYDGTASYSGLRSVTYDGPDFAFLNVYPSPGDGKSMKVDIQGLRDRRSVYLEIFNSQGQVVWSQILNVKNSGYIEEEVVFSDRLRPGLYIARAGQTLYLTQKFAIE